MPIQHPNLFGYEAIVLWNLSLFPVTPPTKYDLTPAEITTWLGNASTSNDPRLVSFSSSNATEDLTPRAHAVRGWMTDYTLPSRMRATITVDHDTGSGKLIHDLLTAWETNAEIGLGLLDWDNSGFSETGLVGNFRISMTKSEPLRNFQSWTVTAIPGTYIDWYES